MSNDGCCSGDGEPCQICCMPCGYAYAICGFICSSGCEKICGDECGYKCLDICFYPCFHTCTFTCTRAHTQPLLRQPNNLTRDLIPQPHTTGIRNIQTSKVLKCMISSYSPFIIPKVIVDLIMEWIKESKLATDLKRVWCKGGLLKIITIEQKDTHFYANMCHPMLDVTSFRIRPSTNYGRTNRPECHINGVVYRLELIFSRTHVVVRIAECDLPDDKYVGWVIY